MKGKGWAGFGHYRVLLLIIQTNVIWIWHKEYDHDSHLRIKDMALWVSPICLYREAMHLQCFSPTRYVRAPGKFDDPVRVTWVGVATSARYLVYHRPCARMRWTVPRNNQSNNQNCGHLRSVVSTSALVVVNWSYFKSLSFVLLDMGVYTAFVPVCHFFRCG